MQTAHSAVRQIAPPKRRVRVLAFVDEFLLPDQTFVFRQMTGLRRCEMRFGARQRVKDCQYPVEALSLIGDSPSAPTGFARRTVQRWRSRLFGEYARLSRTELTRLVTLLGEFRPDIVHAHWGPNAMLVEAACRDLGTPLIVQFHGYDASTLLSDRLYRRALRRLLESAALGITVSDDMRDRLVRIGFSAQKLRRHYIGVPDEFLGSGPPARPPSSKLRLLQVGRMASTKGHSTSLAAVARCVKGGIPVSLRIIGEGPLRESLEAESLSLGLDSIVEFCGRAEPAAVLAAMREADVLLAPSETDAVGRMEGLPIVVVEALAAGLPVIATSHAGIPEAVRYSEPDWLVPERDASALGARIRRLAKDQALRSRLGREGWAWADKHFRLSVQCEALESLYEDILHRRSTSVSIVGPR